MSVDEFDKLFGQPWRDKHQLAAKHAQILQEEFEKQAKQAQNMNAQAQNNQAGSGLLGGYGGGAVYSSGQQTSRRYQPMEKLAMRLDIVQGETFPFEYISAVENKTGGNVVIFIIQNGKPGILEDDGALFPSDGLIAQLNLLRK